MLHVYSYCGEGVYQTGSTNQENLQLSTIKTFESSFFPYCIKEWNNLSEKLCKVQFKIKTTSFIRLKENLIFEIHGITGIKLVNRLRWHLSHLKKQNLRGIIYPICSCCLEPETTPNYFLYCNHCFNLRIELLNDICALNPTSSWKIFECSPVWIGGH